MPVQVITGTQWGDEGKGKVIDVLAARASIVARCQGGSNAGHTVVVGDQRFVLHVVPTGILRPAATCLIGAGVVVDPAGLAEELVALTADGCDPDGRLFLDARVHVITPLHRTLEEAAERRRGASAIGTTMRGIGPAYEAKVARHGLRLVDFFDQSRFEQTFRRLYEHATVVLGDEAARLPSFAQLVDASWQSGQYLKPMVRDVSVFMHEAIERDASILIECAQGALLDIDHGTYPFVTSSTTTAGGACSGLGIGPRSIDRVLGIAKAYVTRVGQGPLPSELDGEAGDALRQAGGEYGATTGRPRRCGWLDLVQLKRAARLNSLDGLALTKLDVLDGRDEIPVVVEYAGDPRGDWYGGVVLEEARPVYRRLPGWSGSTAGCREIDQLPSEARSYLDFIAEFVGVPIHVISVGSDRRDTLHLDPASLETLNSGI